MQKFIYRLKSAVLFLQELIDRLYLQRNTFPFSVSAYPTSFAILIRRASMESATKSVSDKRSSGSHKRCLDSISSAVKCSLCALRETLSSGPGDNAVWKSSRLSFVRSDSLVSKFTAR